MSFEFKHIKAVLRDSILRGRLLEDPELELGDFENYESLSEEKKDSVFEAIRDTLKAWAPFQVTYSSPCDWLPDDAEIFGTRGVYFVETQDDLLVFSSKREAVKYADRMSKASGKTAEAEGCL